MYKNTFDTKDIETGNDEESKELLQIPDIRHIDDEEQDIIELTDMNTNSDLVDEIEKNQSVKTSTEDILPYHVLEDEPLAETANEKQVKLHKKFIDAVKYGTIQDIESILSETPEVLNNSDENSGDINSQEFLRLHRVNAALVEKIPESVLLSARDYRLMSIGAKSSKGTTIPDAVNANDLSVCHWAALRPDKALDILMKHGAKEATNQYGVTSLHLAAITGNANNIATLLDISVDLQKDIDPKTNENEKTTYHCDLTKENSGVIKKRRKYLRGDNYRFYIHLDFDVALIPGATALHLASYYAHPACVSFLLAAGADPFALDAYGRTPLDIAGEGHIHDVINPNSFEEVIRGLVIANGNKKIEEKVGFGSPLHTAITLNSVEALRLLVSAGMPVNWKDKYNGTPLHWCISKKRAEHLKILLQVKFENTAIRPVDVIYANDLTLLHKAILDDWEPGVHIALESGANVAAQDVFGNTPIHYAAGMDNKEILDEVLIAAQGKNVIDIVNETNATPLLNAVRYGKIECVTRILKEEPNIALADLHGYNVFHMAAKIRRFDIFEVLYNHDKELVRIERTEVRDPCVMDVAIKSGCSDIINWLLNKGDAIFSIDRLNYIMYMAPNPTELMEKIFDENITHDKTKENPDCVVSLHYHVLLSGSAEEEQMEFIKRLIATGNRYGQKRLLMHPLVESFLHLKWKALSLFFGIILAFYALFVMSLTFLIISTFGYKNITDVPKILNPTAWTVVLYITLSFIILQEILQLSVTVAPLKRILSFETWVKFFSICPSALLPPVLSSTNISDVEWPRHVASIAVLFSWFEMMFLLSRIPKLGFIVQMFGNVACHVIKILLTFGFVIFGFALTFSIEFDFMPPFENLGSALVKILVMMSSEFDYGDLTEVNTTSKELSSNDTGSYQEDTQDFVPSIGAVKLMFIAFWFFVAIVLMNLMIGVAVDDIQSLEKMGHEMRLEKQVEVLGSLESLLNRNRILIRKLPRYMLSVLKVRDVMILYPNNLSHVCNKKLPSYLREAVFKKAKFQGDLYKGKDIIYQSRDATDEKLEHIIKQVIDKKINELAMRLNESNRANEINSKKLEVIVNHMDKLECKFSEICSKIDSILQLNKGIK